MSLAPTLRRELIVSFALVFTSALGMALVALIFLLPRFQSPEQALLFVIVLLIADLAVFALFGRYVLRRAVLVPIERVIEDVEAIAHGDHDRRLPPGSTQELARLGAAVNRMTDRLVADQNELAANIRSLDETNRMLTEARDAMVHQEKMASVGRLGAGIAHEVGNPLGAILGYLGLLGRSADERARELVTAAEREARRIDRIIRGLLDYARPSDGEVTEFGVNDVLRETLELVGTQGRFESVALELDLADSLPRVSGNAHHLQQVLVNLLVNATDALADTAAPAIEIRTSERTAVRPQHMPARRKGDPPGIDYSHRRRLFAAGRLPREDPYSASGRIVEIVVDDNGPGIPPELREQIFEPFVTTKEPGKGTGLGLAVSARLMETMGGAIRVETSGSGGARFVVLLPALMPEPVSV
jgi:C4-dicarboxylate-specific signal transduction histidine kinase